MLSINGMYIFVTGEDVGYGVSVTEHTVETGIAISDHVKRNAITLTLTGEIVGTNATTILNKLKQIHQTGVLCKYAGRTSLANCLITEFSTSHPNTIWGGCEFSMTLKEIRTASTSYTKPEQKATTKKTGTQQTTKKSTTEYVYHTIKKGDTVWGLVAASKAPYKNLSRPAIDGKKYSACDWVMKMSPSAFSRPGDFRTGQIGRKLIVGVRNGSSASTVSAAKKTYSTPKCRVSVSVFDEIERTRKVVLNYVSGGKKYAKTITSEGTCSVSVDKGSAFSIDVDNKIKMHVFRGAGSWTRGRSGSCTTYKMAKVTKEITAKVTFQLE